MNFDIYGLVHYILLDGLAFRALNTVDMDNI